MSKRKLSFVESFGGGAPAIAYEEVSDARVEAEHGEIVADNLRLENYVVKGVALSDIKVLEAWNNGIEDEDAIDAILEAAMPNWLATLIEKVKAFFKKVGSFFKTMYNKFAMNEKKMRDILLRAQQTLKDVAGASFKNEEIKVNPVKWIDAAQVAGALTDSDELLKVDIEGAKMSEIELVVKTVTGAYSSGKAGVNKDSIGGALKKLEAAKSVKTEQIVNKFVQKAINGTDITGIEIKKDAEKSVKEGELVAAIFDDGDKLTYKGSQELKKFGKDLEKALDEMKLDDIVKTMKDGVSDFEKKEKDWDDLGKKLKNTSGAAKDDDEALKSQKENADDAGKLAQEFSSFATNVSVGITTALKYGITVLIRFFGELKTVTAQLDKAVAASKK